jgi:hypothetical protein
VAADNNCYFNCFNLGNIIAGLARRITLNVNNVLARSHISNRSTAVADTAAAVTVLFCCPG